MGLHHHAWQWATLPDGSRDAHCPGCGLRKPDTRAIKARGRLAYGGHPEFGPRVVYNDNTPTIEGWRSLAKDALLAWEDERAKADDYRDLLIDILTNGEYEKMRAEGAAADKLGLVWHESADRYIVPEKP